MARYIVRIARSAGIVLLFMAAVVLGLASGVFFAYAGDLPQISALDDYAPSTITRVHPSGGGATAGRRLAEVSAAASESGDVSGTCRIASDAHLRPHSASQIQPPERLDLTSGSETSTAART